MVVAVYSGTAQLSSLLCKNKPFHKKTVAQCCNTHVSLSAILVCWELHPPVDSLCNFERITLPFSYGRLNGKEICPGFGTVCVYLTESCLQSNNTQTDERRTNHVKNSAKSSSIGQWNEFFTKCCRWRRTSVTKTFPNNRHFKLWSALAHT